MCEGHKVCAFCDIAPPQCDLLVIHCTYTYDRGERESPRWNVDTSIKKGRASSERAIPSLLPSYPFIVDIYDGRESHTP